MEESRIDKLEKELKELKLKMGTAPKKEKKTREPTEYNKFVKDHLDKLKKSEGDKYNHKEAFKSASAAWSKAKASKQ